ncbi:MAG: hydroxyacid dehydrogenase [Hyphomicrobiales bacterium]|nr:hydroxyacid dehydrogenase [Hyphomicrobiales bacterium]
MATNLKRILATESLSPAGRSVIDARDDIEMVHFPHHLTGEDFQKRMREVAPVHAVILGASRFGGAELDAAGEMMVVARVGVGYDAIDIPTMTQHKIPVMIAGVANSPSVAEQAMFMMLNLAKRATELDALVRERRWNDRFTTVPFDLFEKNVLVVGFGRIGSRTAKRCNAMEMNVLVYDPYKSDEEIGSAGCTAVRDLDAALERADFVTIHCPKTPETVNMFNAERLGRMKETAYLVNTARGGIINETDLFSALTENKLAGAGLDVLELEPPSEDNPLLALDNVILAPHMAGVTREAMGRMGEAAAKNILSVFDGVPMRENMVNPEVLDQ